MAHPQDRANIENKVCHKLETSEVHDFDFRIITRNGDVRWINHICQPVWSENQCHRGRRACNRDITSRKRLEKASITSEERIRALNEEILNMLLVVSHDIRSPLISIAATLKLLHKGVYGKTGESVRNTLNDLYARVNRLLGTAEDFLGKASLVKGDLEVERKALDLREDIIDPILEEFSREIGNQNITIDSRLGAIPAARIPIKANMVWLRIVFRNLFSNAIKYGGNGCTIAFGFEEHDTYYQFNVYNSGIPIPSESLDKLFKRFSRIGVAGEREGNGMGLGLYLVKEIVQKHGGDIWYAAEAGGSNFVFTLPRE
jgi:signal transduction histidine kinase